VASAQSITLAASNNKDHMTRSLLLLKCTTYKCLLFYHISCSWYIAYSTPCLSSGCNTSY